MKKEQYFCDVCNKQIGDERGQDSTTPLQFKSTYQGPDRPKVTDERTFDMVCPTCNQHISEIVVKMIDAVVANIRGEGKKEEPEQPEEEPAAPVKMEPAKRRGVKSPSRV